MQQVTDAFLAELQTSHVIYSYVDVVTATGDELQLICTGGSVTIDRTADTRRHATITCIDPTGVLTPTTAAAILTPFGTQVKPFRGVRYTSGTLNGSTEVAPLGVYRLSKVTVSDVNTGSPGISLELYDLSRTIKRDQFTDTYTVDQGYNIIQAVMDVVTRTLPDAVFDAFSSPAVLNAPMIADSGDDPWAFANTLAAAASCEVFFDGVGRCVIAPPLDVDHLPAPVFSFVEGDNCTMTELDVVLDDEPGFNGVVLVGESVGDETPPVRSIVWDDEPTSPTYYLGPYGQVPQFITDTTVTTQDQADANAQAAFNLINGFPSQLTVTTTVNPALDANDVVLVTRARLGVNSSYGIDSLTIPLDGPTTSALNLRAKRVV